MLFRFLFLCRIVVYVLQQLFMVGAVRISTQAGEREVGLQA